MRNAWKAIAIGEFIVIVTAIVLAFFYVGYKTGFLNEGVRGVLQVIVSIGYTVFLFVGTSGWMLLLGLWKGVDE